ncbi:MAG: bifunctional 4-hydroxy-2-oxoglutarate aldolase/2-dehydro-3-deoxy-phosphogluconate aldolase [Bacillota bacterium]
MDKAKSDVVKTILEERLLAIIRHVGEKQSLKTVETMLQSGVKVVEITLNTVSAIDIIHKLRKEFGSEIKLGAGTVVLANEAAQAMEAGAEFIVTPVIVPEVITYCRYREVTVIPGALTPTEIATAYRLGADIVKVFPANVMGASYFKVLQGPLSHIPLAAVGGVTLENGRSFLDNGAKVLGVGSSLFANRLIKQGDWKELRELANKFKIMAGGKGV